MKNVMKNVLLAVALCSGLSAFATEKPVKGHPVPDYMIDCYNKTNLPDAFDKCVREHPDAKQSIDTEEQSIHEKMHKAFHERFEAEERECARWLGFSHALGKPADLVRKEIDEENLPLFERCVRAGWLSYKSQDNESQKETQQ